MKVTGAERGESQHLIGHLNETLSEVIIGSTNCHLLIKWTVLYFLSQFVLSHTVSNRHEYFLEFYRNTWLLVNATNTPLVCIIDYIGLPHLL